MLRGTCYINHLASEIRGERDEVTVVMGRRLSRVLLLRRLASMDLGHEFSHARCPSCPSNTWKDCFCGFVQSGGSELLMTALSMPLNNCVALGKSFHFCVCESFLIWIPSVFLFVCLFCFQQFYDFIIFTQNFRVSCDDDVKILMFEDGRVVGASSSSVCTSNFPLTWRSSLCLGVCVRKFAMETCCRMHD